MVCSRVGAREATSAVRRKGSRVGPVRGTVRTDGGNWRFTPHTGVSPLPANVFAITCRRRHDRRPV